MIALDTNILVRSVLDDDSALCAHARRLIARVPCHVSVFAIGEMGHVLASVYGAEPSALASACRALLDLPNVECEHEDRLRRALDGVELGVDWADALLWAVTPVNAILLTYDKAFAKCAAILGWNVECRLPKAGK